MKKKIQMDPKHQVTAIKKVAESMDIHERYFSYRQDFGWGAIPVFRKQSINNDPSIPVQFYKRSPKMTDSQMIEALNEMRVIFFSFFVQILFLNKKNHF